MRIAGRRATFWATVAGVVVLTNFAVELLADKIPDVPGLRGFKEFIAYSHKGAS